MNLWEFGKKDLLQNYLNYLEKSKNEFSKTL